MDLNKYLSRVDHYKNEILDNGNENTKKKLTNGRNWSDYQIEQEKRQKEINKKVYENRPEEISLKETMFWFLIICFCICVLTIKF